MLYMFSCLTYKIKTFVLRSIITIATYVRRIIVYSIAIASTIVLAIAIYVT